jgi:hypothetical protein
MYNEWGLKLEKYMESYPASLYCGERQVDIIVNSMDDLINRIEDMLPQEPNFTHAKMSYASSDSWVISITKEELFGMNRDKMKLITEDIDNGRMAASK